MFFSSRSWRGDSPQCFARLLFEEEARAHGGTMRIVNLLAFVTFVASIVLLGVRG